MLILKILWLALIDSLNPTLIAVAIMIIFSGSPKNLWAYISGILFTTIIQQLVLYFGLDKLLSKILINTFLNGWILIFIGCGLIVYSLYFWQQRYKTPNIKKWESISDFGYTDYLKYVILGCATTIAETPTAFLLVLAVVEVQKAGINTIWALVCFCLYAVFYTFPLIVLTLIASWQQKRLKIWLNSRLNWIFIRMNICLSLSLLAVGILILSIGIKLLMLGFVPQPNLGIK